MSQYPIPPPSYGSTSPSPKSPNAPLYSSNRYQGEPGPSAGIYNQPAPGDLPDDFKVRLDRILCLAPSLTSYIVRCHRRGELSRNTTRVRSESVHYPLYVPSLILRCPSSLHG